MTQATKTVPTKRRAKTKRAHRAKAKRTPAPTKSRTQTAVAPVPTTTSEYIQRRDSLRRYEGVAHHWMCLGKSSQMSIVYQVGRFAGDTHAADDHDNPLVYIGSVWDRLSERDQEHVVKMIRWGMVEWAVVLADEALVNDETEKAREALADLIPIGLGDIADSIGGRRRA